MLLDAIAPTCCMWIRLRGPSRPWLKFVTFFPQGAPTNQGRGQIAKSGLSHPETHKDAECGLADQSRTPEDMYSEAVDNLNEIRWDSPPESSQVRLPINRPVGVQSKSAVMPGVQPLVKRWGDMDSISASIPDAQSSLSHEKSRRLDDDR